MNPSFPFAASCYILIASLPPDVLFAWVVVGISLGNGHRSAPASHQQQGFALLSPTAFALFSFACAALSPVASGLFITR